MVNGKSGYLREQMEQTAMTVLLALKVKQARKAMRVQQVPLGSKATWGLLVLRALKDFKVFQVK
jgi:hypothetical protein